MFRGCQNPNYVYQWPQQEQESPLKSGNSASMSTQLKVRKINYKASPYQVFSANNPFAQSMQTARSGSSPHYVIGRPESKTDILDDFAKYQAVTEILDESAAGFVVGQRNYRVFQTDTYYAYFSAKNIAMQPIRPAKTTKSFNTGDVQYDSIRFEELSEERQPPQEIQEIYVSGPSIRKATKADSFYSEASVSPQYNVQSSHQTQGTRCCYADEPQVVYYRQIYQITVPDQVHATDSAQIERKAAVDMLKAQYLTTCGVYTLQPTVYPNRDATHSLEPQDSLILRLETNMRAIEQKHGFTRDATSQRMNINSLEPDSNPLASQQYIRGITEYKAHQTVFQQETYTVERVHIAKIYVTTNRIDPSYFVNVRYRINQLQYYRKTYRREDIDIVDSIVSGKLNLLDPYKISSPRYELSRLLADSPEQATALPNFYREARNNESMTAKNSQFSRAPSLPQANELRILRETPPKAPVNTATAHLSDKMNSIRKRVGIPNNQGTPSMDGRATKNSIAAFDYSHPTTLVVTQCALHCISTIFLHGKYDAYHVTRVAAQRNLDYGATAYFFNALERQLVEMVVYLDYFVSALTARLNSKMQDLETHVSMIETRAHMLKRADLSSSETPVREEYLQIQEQYHKFRSELLRDLL